MDIIVMSVTVILLFLLFVIFLVWYMIGDFYKPPFPHNIRGRIPDNPQYDGFISPTNAWDTKLKVRVWGKATEPQRTILFVHGWDSSMGHFHRHIVHYQKLGYRVVAIDFRSHGESEHNTFISVFNIADDIQNTITWIHTQYDVDTLFIWAHSLGGVSLIVGLGYHLIEETLIDYAIVEGIYANGSYIVNRFIQQYSIPHYFVTYVLSPLMRTKLISTLNRVHPQYDKLKREILTLKRADFISPVNNLYKISLPLLSIHAKDDPVVAFSEFETLINNRSTSHEYIVLETGGHFKTATTTNFFQLVDQKLQTI